MPPKRIVHRQGPTPPPDVARRLAAELGVSDRIVRILARRGLYDGDPRERMDGFLSPLLRRLAPPERIPGLLDAADLIAARVASDRGASLCFWGDYDVDGVTSVALLASFLRQRGFSPRTFLPDRIADGYGLNVDGVLRLADAGVKTLVSLDCGVNDVEPVAAAKARGLAVIVVDHHLPHETTAAPDVMVNPKLSNAPDGLADLAAVGVAFLLACTLNRRLPGDALDMRAFLDLVALGTIADVAPMTGQNRILCKNGLLKLAEGDRPGVAALKTASGLDGKPFSEGSVGFQLGPRLNAAGRLESAESALALLLAPDLAQARPHAEHLDVLNTERKAEEARILEAALAQAALKTQRLGLVLYGEDFNPGVVGIVASRAAEALYRPVMILGGGGEAIKGSGRSIPECDLHAALTECAVLLARFGGHRQAAGATLCATKLPAFEEAFDRAVSAQLGGALPTPSILVEETLPFADVTRTLLDELDLLRPFGPKNPEPVFLSPTVAVKKVRLFGENGVHASLTLRDELFGVGLNAKYWREAGSLPPDLLGRKLAVAFTPKLDAFFGTPAIELAVRECFFE